VSVVSRRRVCTHLAHQAACEHSDRREAGSGGKTCTEVETSETATGIGRRLVVLVLAITLLGLWVSLLVTLLIALLLSSSA
jgi:hypothetical protein